MNGSAILKGNQRQSGRPEGWSRAHLDTAATRAVSILEGIVLTSATLLVSGAVLQLVLFSHVFFVPALFEIQVSPVTTVIGWVVWITGPIALAMVLGACVVAGWPLEVDGVGVAIGALAYPAWWVGLFLAWPESLTGGLAYTHLYVAVPVSVSIGLVWLFTRAGARLVSRRNAGTGRATEPRRESDRVSRPPGL
jgi:hypothetical protein